jgi:hypothetical protein
MRDKLGYVKPEFADCIRLVSVKRVERKGSSSSSPSLPFLSSPSSIPPFFHAPPSLSSFLSSSSLPHASLSVSASHHQLLLSQARLLAVLLWPNHLQLKFWREQPDCYTFANHRKGTGVEVEEEEEEEERRWREEGEEKRGSELKR